MRRRGLSLTLRTVLIGAGAALIPFVGAIVFISLAPDHIIQRQARADSARAVRSTITSISAERARLTTALSNIPDRQLRAAVRAPAERQVIARQIAEMLGDDVSTSSINVASSDVTGHARPIPAPLISAAARTVDDHMIVVSRRVDDAWLRDATSDTGAQVMILQARDARPAIVLAATDAVSDDQSLYADVTSSRVTWTPVGATPAVVRVANVADAPGLRIVAFERGDRFALLFRDRKPELQLALLLLLGSGVCGGIATALFVNRTLRRVARQAEQIAGGDYDVRMPIVGRDAGARVASSLNQLASDVQSRITTLEQTVSLLDTTLASIDDGIVVWTASHELVIWNAAMVKLTGVRRDDASSSGAATIAKLLSESAPGHRRSMLPIGDGSRDQAVDLVVRHIHGGGLLQVVRDATPAIAIQQARENFMITAAHELRTPLASIMGFAATLGDHDLNLAPDVRDLAITNIVESSTRLEQTIARFFEGSLLLTEGIDISIAPVEARELFTHIDRATRSITSDVGVRIQDPGRMLLRVDRDIAVRSFRELIDNACKYGDGPIEISVVHSEADDVCICVRDHGAGIPRELRDAVFEPFHRIDPHMRDAVGGVGMGLYTARRQIEAMGGSIVLTHPDSGTGLLCQVTLPLAT